jgi:hypothetical protein
MKSIHSINSSKTLPPTFYYCIPESELKSVRLYRYTKNNFIDLFFNTGRLRLNSLKVYQAEQKPDEQLNVEIDDREEGKALVVKSNVSNVPLKKDFSNGFLNLSTSFTLSEEIRQAFETAAGREHTYGIYEITNPIAFGRAVSDSIHRKYPLQHIMAGKCDYVEERDKIVEAENMSFIGNWQRDLASALGATEAKEITQDVIKVFFLKAKQLSHQSEFRYLWKSQDLIGKEYLDIDVPEAVQYCRRLGPQHP